MATTIVCSLKGCEVKARSQNPPKGFSRSKKYCNGHYRRWLKFGNPRFDTGYRTRTGCNVEGCNKKHHALGHCRNHYRLLAKYGKPENVFEMHHTRCRVKYCRHKHEGKGYCGMHYKKWKRYGDPLASVRKKYNYNKAA